MTSRLVITRASDMPPRRRSRDWGPWRLDCDGPDDPDPALMHTGIGYFVRLIECLDSAEALDWVAQVAAKGWADDATVAGLVRALDDVLRLQANLCGCGVGKRVTPEAIQRAAWRTTTDQHERNRS